MPSPAETSEVNLPSFSGSWIFELLHFLSLFLLLCLVTHKTFIVCVYLKLLCYPCWLWFSYFRIIFQTYLFIPLDLSFWVDQNVAVIAGLKFSFTLPAFYTCMKTFEKNIRNSLGLLILLFG